MCQLNLLNRQLNQVNPIEFIEIDQEEEYPEVVRGSLVIKLSFLNDSHWMTEEEKKIRRW